MLGIGIVRRNSASTNEFFANMIGDSLRLCDPRTHFIEERSVARSLFLKGPTIEKAFHSLGGEYTREIVSYHSRMFEALMLVRFTKDVTFLPRIMRGKTYTHEVASIRLSDYNPKMILKIECLTGL